MVLAVLLQDKVQEQDQGQQIQEMVLLQHKVLEQGQVQALSMEVVAQLLARVLDQAQVVRQVAMVEEQVLKVVELVQDQQM